MGGLIGLAINGLAALRLAGTGLFILAALSSVASFWSWGVLMNFRETPELAPNWASSVNLLSLLMGIVLTILSFNL